MMRWAPGSSLQKRRILACSILLAALVCAALPGVSEASRKIRGVGFTTIVPSTWKIGKGKQGGTRFYGAASPTTKRNTTANQMQLGISVVPVKDLERQLGHKLPSSLEDLAGSVVSAPQGAQGVQLTAPVRATILDGLPAASSASQFFFNGVTVLQSDTVAVYHGRVYVIDFEIDLNLQYRALPILARLHRHWHWR